MLKQFITILLVLFISKAAYTQNTYPQLTEKNNKRIYTDSLGKQIGEAYDYAQPFFDGRAIVTKKINEQRQLNGVIDVTGKYIVPLEERFMVNYGLGLIGANKAGAGLVLYNAEGKLIYTCQDCRPQFLRDLRLMLLQTQARDKKPANAVLIDLQGKTMFSVNTERVETISDHRTLPAGQNTEMTTPYFLITKNTPSNNWINVVIDVNGRTMVDSTSGFRFENSLAVVQEGKKVRVVDTLFHDIIPFSAGYEWGMVLPQHPQRAIAVKKNGRYGVVDPKNRIILPLRSLYLIDYRPYEKQYLINSQSADSAYVLSYALDTIVSPEVRMPVNQPNQGIEGPVVSFAKNTTLNKYGYRDAKGKMAIPFIFDYLSPVQHDSMLFFRGDTAGFISTRGKRLFRFPVPCAGAGWLKNGRALYVQSIAGNDSITCGLVDPKGNLMHNQVFNSFSPFLDGRAMVSRGNDYFFVDSLLHHLKLNNKYDYRTYYKNGFAGITDGKYFGIVHLSGKIVLPVEYDLLDAEVVVDRFQTEFENAAPFIYVDKTGEVKRVPGSLLVLKTTDSRLEVKKAGNKFLIDLSSLEAAGSGPAADTLNQWYTVNPIYRENTELPQHPKLVTDAAIKIIADRTKDRVTFISKTSGLPVSSKTFETAVELNRYGAIAINQGRYSFINNAGKVLLENYGLIRWDNGQLEARNYGPFATGLPEQNSLCYKSEFYDVNGKKKFEQLWHDHAAFRNDTIAYFRFGRTLSIVGRSGKVYLQERLIEGNPFKAICHNRLVYVLTRGEKTPWVVFDAFKQELYSLNLPGDAEIGPYKISDTLFGYYDTYGVRRFVNAQGRELPFILEPDVMAKDEEWGSYFAQDEFIVMQKEGRRFGMMNRSGKMVIPFRYKVLSAFIDGYAFCQDSTLERSLINKQGKICLDKFAQEDLYLQNMTGQYFTFYEGLALCSYNCRAQGPPSKYGDEDVRSCFYYRDTTGKAVLSLPGKYVLAGNFSEGLAAVLDKDLKLGYIDRQGKEVIPCRFPLQLQQEPLPLFKGGVAYLFGQRGYIDKKGKTYFR